MKKQNSNTKTVSTLLIALLLFISVNCFSQSVKIDLNLKDASLKEFFQEIEKQSEYSFFYKDDVLQSSKKIDISFQNTDINSVLKKVLSNYKLSYKINDQLILVYPDTEKLNKLVKKKRELFGRVSRVEGESIPGANVRVKGTYRGTTTNENGEFRIELNANDTVLVFSFIGFKSQQLVCSNLTYLNVKLHEAIIGLDDVVAIGYGNAKSSDVTGAISSIQIAALRQSPISSIDQGIGGRAAGVRVTQTSGMPGAIAEIRIRGINSLEGGNEPLYVIDGFPVYNGTGYGNTGGYAQLSGLSAFNPSDIESIEILKDAAATAIYGSRASNGVILISTMSDVDRQDKVLFEAYYGIQNVAKTIELMNASQYAALLNDVQASDGLPPIFSSDELQQLDENGTDWQEEIFNPAKIENYQLKFYGGQAKTKYVVSGSYFNQDGIIINSGFKRFSGRINLERSLRKNLNIGTFMTLSGSVSDNVRTNTRLGSRGVVNSALHFNPILPVYENKSDGTYTPANLPGTDYPNPVATANETLLNNKAVRWLTNIYGNLYLGENLHARFTFGADLFVTKEDQYSPSILYESATGSGSVRSAYAFNWLSENSLNWEKEIADGHRLIILGGLTVQRNSNEGALASSKGFVNDLLMHNNLGAGAVYNQPDSWATQWNLVSWLGRINYKFNEKYLLNFNMRVDGSSRFGKNNKYAFFPAGSFAWRLSEEEFIKEIESFSNLKLRLSYGVTGNQEIGLYNSLSTMRSNTYTIDGNLVTGFYPGNIPKPDLKWEKTAQFNVGMDFGFINNKLRITTDFYKKKTSDLIYNVLTPLISGYSTAIDNVGEIQNRGWELFVDGNILNGDFKWNSSINFALNKNEVVALGGESFKEIESSGNLLHTGNVHRLILGESIGVFYGYVSDGIFQDDNELSEGPAGPTNWAGGYKYKDISGPNNVPDGVIDATFDRTIIGNPNPDFFGGLSNTFGYKGLMLDIFMQYSYGNDILNYNSINLSTPNGNHNVYSELVNRWTPNNPSNIYPKASSDRTVLFSDRYIEDGSFFKIKTITLSYSFPKLKIKRIQDFKVYVTGQNLFTFTKYSGYDPEVSYRGISNVAFGEDFGGYPHSRTIMLGVKLTTK